MIWCMFRGLGADPGTNLTIGSLFVTQNAYPREALMEAVLRFVEEDLAARGK